MVEISLLFEPSESDVISKLLEPVKNSTKDGRLGDLEVDPGYFEIITTGENISGRGISFSFR